MSIVENKRLIADFMRLFSAGDLNASMSMMNETATWWVAGSFAMSGTKTKKQLMELLSHARTLLPEGITITPTAMTAESDRVAVEADGYARHANGKIYNNKYHFLFLVREGKIEAVKEYLDTMHANDVLCSS